MRALQRFASLTALALLVSSAAQAAPLAFTGTLSIALGTLVLPAQVGAATALVNGGFGGALQLQGGSLSTTTTTTTTTGGSMIPHINVNPVGGTFATKNAVTPVTGVMFVNFLTLTNVNGPGSFALGLAPPPTLPPPTSPAFVLGGGVGGLMPILGSAHVCLFCNNPGDITFPVPLSVIGVGGTAFGGVAGIFVTVWGAPWTTGTAVAVTTTTTFGQQVFNTAQGFDNRTASGGQVQLVTPIVVKTNVAPLIAGFATMTLDFSPVPEPGGLLLALGGISFLAVALRKRHGA